MLVNLVEAVDLALAYALNEDENVLILGEDVAKNGGGLEPSKLTNK